MNESQVTIEEVNDAGEIVRRQEHRECSQRNWDWLRAHGADLLPQAFGMFLAVAGQEAFLAVTLEEALNWANAATHEAQSVGYGVPHADAKNCRCSPAGVWERG